MPPTKNSKRPLVIWEYEQSKEVWTRYEEKVSKTLTSRCKQKETTIAVKNKEFKINFADMTQKDTDTGFHRFVRCCVCQKDDQECDEYFAWEMSDNGKLWRSVTGKIIADLETAYQNFTIDRDKAPSTISISDFTFDFDPFQAHNNAASKRFDLRRIKIDAEPKTSIDSSDEQQTSKHNDQNGNANSKTATAKSRKRPATQNAENGVKSEKSKKLDSEKSAKSTLKTVVIKGKAPVDPECAAKVSVSHVFCDVSGTIYDCMLNQTNISQNNNKFYLIQLLEEDQTNNYSVWLRWGRVGFTGQTNLINCGSNLELAKKTFCSKFYDKTRNHWSEKQNFEKVAGKYDLIEVDYDASGPTKHADADSSDEIKPPTKALVESKLDVRLQNLLKIICDLKNMEQTVKEMQYDSDKSPLGKLTKAQIKAGYEALSKIEQILEKDNGASSTALAQACSEFYTRIPHSFGMKVPPLIRDKAMLKQKTDLLDTLADIEIAIRVLEQNTEQINVHQLDKHYSSLNCLLNPLDHDSQEFKMVDKYLQNTHASTHNMYKMKLLDVFSCSKNGENEKFMQQLDNRMLLWHGSRLSNWYGIMSQGLRIAPPEAPCTGYMFGKGVYFADSASKSANYCFASASKNVGLAVLCEVALGKCNELHSANYNADKLPADCRSTKGLGKTVPDPSEYYTMPNGCIVPLGRLTNVVDERSKEAKNYSLYYNEYIVYNINQILMRYLVKIEFVY